jgi:CRP/FNR family transcriptional regulator
MHNTELINYLRSLHPLEARFVKLLSEKVQQHVFKKGRAVQEPLRSSSVWYVARGILKASYFDQQGNEHVTRFWYEDQIILLEANAYQSIPSADYLIMLEDTVLLSLPDPLIGYCLKNFPETQALRSNIFHKDRDRAEVLGHLVKLPLAEAYQKFQAIYPVNRIPVKDIASYLGVHPKRISELRGKK